MSVTNESSMEVLRQQLPAAQTRVPTNQYMQPSHSRPDSPSTLAGTRTHEETLNPPNYYHVGSAADPGYADPMRNAKSGPELFSSTRGARVVTALEGSSSDSIRPSNTLSVLLRQLDLGYSYPLSRISIICKRFEIRFQWNT